MMMMSGVTIQLLVENQPDEFLVVASLVTILDGGDEDMMSVCVFACLCEWLAGSMMLALS